MTGKSPALMTSRMTRVPPPRWLPVAPKWRALGAAARGTLALLAVTVLPTTTLAADRLHWQAGRDPALTDAFSAQWQAQRGSAPLLLDNPTDTVLTVSLFAPSARARNSTTLQLFLQVPRLATPAARHESGIYAEPSTEALLKLWQQLLPDRRPAGLLIGAASRSLWPAWRESAQRQGLSLRPGFVRAGEQAQRVFNLIRPGIGVLLYSTEMATDDPVALTVILRESLSSGLPVFGANPDLLPAGAFAVLYQDPAARGTQAAQLALQLLQGESPGWQEPEGLQHDINHQVVRTLQLPLAIENQHNKTPSENKTSTERPLEQTP